MSGVSHLLLPECCCHTWQTCRWLLLLLLYAYFADFLVAAKAANLSLPIFGGDALADYMLYEKLRGRPSLIGKLTTTSVSPGSKDYVRAFTNFTGGDAKTSYQAYAAHAYDAVAALLRAYKAAAAPKDGPAVKAALGKLDFPGGGQLRSLDFEVTCLLQQRSKGNLLAGCGCACCRVSRSRACWH